MSRKSLTFGTMVLLCALALISCGRKGALEPPPTTKIEAENNIPVEQPQQQDKPFILDRLIKS